MLVGRVSNETRLKLHYEQYIRDFNAHDVTKLRDYYHDTINLVLNPDPLTYVEKSIGVDHILTAITETFNAFDNYTFTIQELLTNKNGDIAVYGYYHGNHTGEYKGIDPTGNEIRYEAALFYHINEGKISKIRRTTDNLSLYLQLGNAVMNMNNKHQIEQYLDRLTELGLLPNLPEDP